MKKVAFHTLGCKLNFSETSAIGKQFLEKGFSIVDFDSGADIYVINTCSVTENADRECRQIVRRALRLNPEAFVAVTGCYAQLRPDELSGIQGVDLVLGSNEKFDIFSYTKDFEKRTFSCVQVSNLEEMNSFHPAFSTEADDRTRAFLKIQDGCDYKCSFCTIPAARGKSRSNNSKNVLEQFRTLLDEGYKEIILTGVNVGDYGKHPNEDLHGLLRRLIAVDGEYRIRISSIEPNLLSDKIIELTSDSSKLCSHFHIPLQSGSPKILKLMQRRYKTEDFRELILKLKKRIPEAGIGVDVIVGFPGETNEDFLETYNFLKDLPISYLHVFTYSERPGTAALEIPGKVDVPERKRRNNMLRILSEKKRREFYGGKIGNTEEVLFEGENKNGYVSGFSSSYVRVKHPFNFDLVNKFTNVKITGVKENICTAEPINNNKTLVMAG